MKIIKKIDDIKKELKQYINKGISVGYVPTMGYLHEGHESLIKKAREENDILVVSIFVNPIQFGPTEDLSVYPRDLKHDENICSKHNVDIIFAPEVDEMFPDTLNTHVNVSLLTDKLCGERRPGHFQGVCTILSKFFNIISPNNVYFGQKDAQQLAVVKKMVKDLNFNVKITGCPIVREKSGLAKSSRNSYLSDNEKSAALILNKSLKKALDLLNSGERNVDTIKNCIKNSINSEPLAKIDYIEIVDSLTIQPVDKINNSILVAIAVYIGKIRLIDNFSYKPM